MIDYSDGDVWGRVARFLGSEAVARSSRNCGRWECGPDWRLRLALPDFDLWFVIRGRGRMSILNAGEERDVSAGMMVLLRPGDSVTAEQMPDDPLTVLAVHMYFADRVSDAVVDVPPDLLPQRFLAVRDAASLELQMSRLIRLDAHRDPLSRLESSNLLQDVLVLLYRQDAENRGFGDLRGALRFDRLVAHVDQMPLEWMSLADAASYVGLSADYFSRVFAEEFGMGFRQFCLQRRLDRAQRLLQETDLTVGEVAESLGYGDMTLLSRQFKVRFGVSPKQSRRAITG